MVKELIILFGKKGSLYLYIILYSAGSLLFMNGTNLLFFVLGATIFGIADQFIVILVKMLLTDSFGDDYSTFLSICYSGYAFCSILVPSFMNLIINPSSLGPTAIFDEGGVSVSYFTEEVYQRLTNFYKIQLLVHAAVLVPLYTYLKLEKDEGGILWNLVGLIRRGQSQKASKIFIQSKIKIEQQLQNSIRSSFRASISQFALKGALVEPILQNKIELETIPERDTNEYLESIKTKVEIDETVDESFGIHYLFTKTFIFFFLIGLIRNMTTRYFVSNFKIVGLYFLNDDSLVTKISSFAFFGYLFMCFAFGPIISFTGIKTGYLIMLVSLAAFCFGFTINQSPFFFFLLSLWQRVI